MTSAPVIADWRQRAEGLADQLVASGVLHDPAWRAALCAVPRHALVPRYYQQGGPDAGWSEVAGADVEQRDHWLTALYSNTAVFTALAPSSDHVGQQVGVSSTSQPSLMIRMLEALDVHDGMRVLEIGTGTGYNAALLAHRLGDGNVYSVDVDSNLVDLARQRLASIGRHPQLAALDGVDGWPQHGPYHRIIATCSVPRVPWSWADQLVPGGLVLVDLKLAIAAGNLALLRRGHDRLEGRFRPKFGAFMEMRHPGEAVTDQRPSRAPLDGQRTTAAPPQPWSDHREVWFLATLDLPGVRYGYTLDPSTRKPKAATLSAPDGSWCEVELADDAGARAVREGGPTPLWVQVEHAYQRWHAWDRPDWTRFGVTVTADEQRLWLDERSNVITETA